MHGSWKKIFWILVFLKHLISQKDALYQRQKPTTTSSTFVSVAAAVAYQKTIAPAATRNILQHVWCILYNKNIMCHFMCACKYCCCFVFRQRQQQLQMYFVVCVFYRVAFTRTQYLRQTHLINLFNENMKSISLFSTDSLIKINKK